MSTCKYCGKLSEKCGPLNFPACSNYNYRNLYTPYTPVVDADGSCQRAPAKALTGGSSDYYKLPLGATDLLDLIEHKNMGFGIGNIFKACYRLGDKAGTTRKYDLEKIIFFANRELQMELFREQ